MALLELIVVILKFYRHLCNCTYDVIFNKCCIESDDEDEVDECPCQKCGKGDHPEWILLCDTCDGGWHCSCLRPPLFVIPEGDWFCPPCQHVIIYLALVASQPNSVFYLDDAHQEY